MTSFEDHEHAALEDFINHLETCRHKPSFCPRPLDEVHDMFHEGRQMKMVGEIVKLKWEVSCPYQACPMWAVYYCVMTAAEWKPPRAFDFLH